MGKDIWYAAYGSNLSYERFKLYILGGKSKFIDKDYIGCENKRLPIAFDQVKIPYELYFSQASSHWENKAVAFIKHQKNESLFTNCRLYKIEQEQFVEILQQENKIESNHDLLALDFDTIRKQGSYLIGKVDECRWYGKIVYLGQKNNTPIFTFTAKWNDDQITYRKPSYMYLTLLITGLRETNLRDKEIFDYLIAKQGIKSNFSEKELVSLIEISNGEELRGQKKFRVERTEDRRNTGGDFIAILNPKDITGKSLPKSIVVKNKIKEREFVIKVSAQYDKKVKSGIIHLDQKIRNALGVDIEEIVIVNSFKESWKNRFLKVLKNKFGVQYNIVRTKNSIQNDMEISICRISQETMQSIGVEDGDAVVIECLNKSIKIRAFEITELAENTIQERQKIEKEKYTNCTELLGLRKKSKYAESSGVEIDILPVLIDGDQRKTLGVEQCDPVRISRSISSQIIKRLHLISVPLILAIVGAIISFQELNQNIKISILSAGIVVVIILSFISIREPRI